MAVKALLGIAALFATLAAVSPDVTTLSNHHRLVVVRPEASPMRGVILLIPGGDTKLRVGPTGQTRSSNFVIRTRETLLSDGFAIAYMDDPSDLREPIERLREIAKPVVVLSTSRGTIVAAANAARLGERGPDLLVLTSPVTVSTARYNSLSEVNLRPIAIPTLVITNVDDSCAVSPPGGAAGLVARLAHPSYMEFASKEIMGDPCEPYSPHGYLGIEDEVLSKIVGWIADHARN